jgi:hypothetical protein
MTCEWWRRPLGTRMWPSRRPICAPWGWPGEARAPPPKAGPPRIAPCPVTSGLHWLRVALGLEHRRHRALPTELAYAQTNEKLEGTDAYMKLKEASK